MYEASLTLYDYEPDTGNILEEVLEGLRKSQKTLPCKYIYDERGSGLFDQICELEEYYPTRTELSILSSRAQEMADIIGDDRLVIEYGSGSSTKTPILLKSLDAPKAYVPIDISKEHLINAAENLKQNFPNLEIIPVCADYTAEFDLPDKLKSAKKRLIFFPGSTIGNFEPAKAKNFLGCMRKLAGMDGGILIGVDLKKEPEILHAAYNDKEGVTAEFNLNVLCRINRELNTNFQLDQFVHRAFFNESENRVEMHLVSQKDQSVQIDGELISFQKGESIHTESSYKYTLNDFYDLTAQADLSPAKVWTDEQQWFSVHYLTSASVQA